MHPDVIVFCNIGDIIQWIDISKVCGSSCCYNTNRNISQLFFSLDIFFQKRNIHTETVIRRNLNNTFLTQSHNGCIFKIAEVRFIGNKYSETACLDRQTLHFNVVIISFLRKTVTHHDQSH